MAITETPDQAARIRPEKIRKEFVYTLTWPSEHDVDEPVYSGPNQAVELAWPGMIVGGGIHGLLLYFIHLAVFGHRLDLDMFFFFALVAAGVSLSLSVFTGSTIYLATLCFNTVFKGVMSTRRAILVAGGCSLLPVSFIHAIILRHAIGGVAFAVCIIPGIWVGAYVTAWFAAAAGKWKYTDQPPKRFDLLQFRIRDMLIATAFVALIVMIDQALSGYYMLFIISLIVGGFFFLFLFDQKWMKYHAKF